MDGTEQSKSEPFRHGMSIHTSRAIDFLKNGKPGDTIGRSEMAERIGRSVETGELGYGNVQSAIRHVERSYRVVWRWDKDAKAWRCLSDEEKVAEESKLKQKSHRTIGRSLVVASAVNFENLSEEAKREHNLNVAVAGVMRLAGGGRLQKTLESQGGKGTSFIEPNLEGLVGLMKSKS